MTLSYHRFFLFHYETLFFFVFRFILFYFVLFHLSNGWSVKYLISVQNKWFI